MTPVVLFVAITTGGFGALLLVSALANWDWYKGLVDYAVIEAVFGEDAARWVCGVSGVALLVGSAVMLIQGKL